MTTIAISKTQHRFDNAVKPIITIGGQGSFPKLFIRNYLYLEMPPSYIWNPPNRTDYPLTVEVRDLFLSNWTLSAGVTNSSNNFTKTATEGFSGAQADTIASGDCSIEGKPGFIYGTCCFALQSGTPSYDYFNPAGDVEHALVFNQSPDGVTGIGFIRERGVEKMRFTWAMGDGGLVEKKGDIVRYYRIKADGSMVLLRSKRSLLTYPITPTVVLFHVGSIANSVRIWNGSGANTSIELYGVLENFQDWQNQSQIESLADKTLAKDKREDFTYFSDKRQIRTLSVNLGSRQSATFRAMEEFFRWHDLDRLFIFKDAARSIEFFAQFVSAFKDNPLGNSAFGVSADIRESIDSPILTV